MIKLDKDYIRCLLKKAPQRKNASAWCKGVKNYADMLMDNLLDDYCMIFDNQRELEEQMKFFKKILLNGADNWNQYSYGAWHMFMMKKLPRLYAIHQSIAKLKAEKNSQTAGRPGWMSKLEPWFKLKD